MLTTSKISNKPGTIADQATKIAGAPAANTEPLLSR